MEGQREKERENMHGIIFNNITNSQTFSLKSLTFIWKLKKIKMLNNCVWKSFMVVKVMFIGNIKWNTEEYGGNTVEKNSGKINSITKKNVMIWRALFDIPFSIKIHKYIQHIFQVSSFIVNVFAFPCCCHLAVYEIVNMYI